MSESINLLCPLDRFYARAGRPLPHIDEVSGDEMPEPYRRLLVGDHDMTPTLQAFYGEDIHLRVLERTADEQALARLVVLVTDQSSRAIEFGAIDINLHPFPREAWEAVLGCRMPLGGILARYEIEHYSHPRAFFRIEPDEFIQEALCASSGTPLYGRRNALTTADGVVIADILEILPP